MAVFTTKIAHDSDSSDDHPHRGAWGRRGHASTPLYDTATANILIRINQDSQL